MVAGRKTIMAEPHRFAWVLPLYLGDDRVSGYFKI